MSRKLKGKFILKALKKNLKEHDWTYEMSDDHSYWLSGTAQREKIRKKKKVLPGMERSD